VVDAASSVGAQVPDRTGREHDVVATKLVSEAGQGSFLLDLLYLAGWRLRVREGETVRILATRGDIALDVTRASLPEAAGAVFAQAMRSGRKGHRPEAA
jgi:hypothetical protein